MERLQEPKKEVLEEEEAVASQEQVLQSPVVNSRPRGFLNVQYLVLSSGDGSPGSGLAGSSPSQG